LACQVRESTDGTLDHATKATDDTDSVAEVLVFGGADAVTEGAKALVLVTPKQEDVPLRCKT